MRQSSSGTFGRLQPLLLDAVADLSLGLALRQVALDHGRVALVHLDVLLVVGLEVTQLWKTHQEKRSQFDIHPEKSLTDT